VPGSNVVLLLVSTNSCTWVPASPTPPSLSTPSAFRSFKAVPEIEGTKTVVGTEEVLSVRFASFSALRICAEFENDEPPVADELTVAWYVREPLAPGASEPRFQVMVLPVTVHEPLQLPGKYVRMLGSVSVNWTPVAPLAAVDLF
jgi:hypothetical protein